MPQSNLKHRTAQPTNTILGLILGLIGVTIFGGTLPATRVAVEWFEPWFLTFARAMIATLTAAVCILIMRKRFPLNRLSALGFVGLTLVYGFPGFMALAMQTVPSSHGGVVLGILPLATAVFAVLLTNERPSLLFWVCSVSGALLIALFAMRDGELGFEIGDLWLLIAGLLASSGYVVSGKLSHEMPGWEVICWALILTAPISLAGTIWLWESKYLTPQTEPAIALAYVSFGSMFLGFFAWNAGLKHGGVAKVAQLQLLQTFITLAIAVFVLDEAVTGEMMMFALAVLALVFIGQRARIATKQ